MSDGQVVIEITGDAARFNAAVNSIASTTASRLNSIGDGFTKVGKAVTVGVTAPLTAVGALALKTAVDFTKLYESTMITFESMLGGSKAAQQLYNSLLDTAKASTYSQETFLTAAKKLVGMGLSADQTSSYLQAATDAVAAFGGSADSILAVSDIFAKVSTAGRIYMDDVNSLANNGINALQILANQYNVTTDEMRAMISDGAVPAKEGLDKLTQGIEKGTQGAAGYTQAMEGMAAKLKGGTLTGALDGINTAIRSFALALIGINPTLKETDAGYAESQRRIEQLTASIVTISEIIPLLAQVFSGVTAAIGDLLSWLTGTNVRLDENAGKWGNVNGALGDFKRYLEETPTEELAKIGNLIAAIAIAGPGLIIVGNAFKLLGSAVQAVQGAYEKSTDVAIKLKQSKEALSAVAIKSAATKREEASAAAVASTATAKESIESSKARIAKEQEAQARLKNKGKLTEEAAARSAANIKLQQENIATQQAVIAKNQETIATNAQQGAQAKTLSGRIALTAATIGNSVAMAAQTMATNIATIATMAFGVALKALPFVAVFAAVTAVVGVIADFVGGLFEANDPMKQLTASAQEQKDKLDAAQSTYDTAVKKYGALSDEAGRAKAALDEQTSAFNKSAQTLEEFTQECEDVVTAHNELMDSIAAAAQEAQAEAGSIDNLASRYEGLAKSADGSVESNAQLEAAQQALAKSSESVAEALGDEESAALLTTEQIVALARADANRLRANSYSDAYVKALEDQEKATFQLGQAKAELEAQEDKNSTASKELQTQIESLEAAQQGAISTQSYALQKMEETAEAEQKLTQAMEFVKDGYGTVEEAAEAYGVTVDELNNKMAEESASAAAEYNTALNEMSSELRELVAENDALSRAMTISGVSTTDLAQTLADAGMTVDDLGARIETYAATATNGLELVSTQSDVTTAQMLTNLRANADETANWANNIQTLYAQAGSESEREFIGYLESLGVENASLAQELVDGTGTSMAELAEAYGYGAEMSATKALEGIGKLPEGTTELLSETETAVQESGENAGVAYAEGTATGIENGAADIQSAVEEAVNVEATFESVKANASTTGQSIGTNIATGISNTSAGISNALNIISKGVSTTLATVGTNARSAGAKIGTETAAGITSTSSTIRAAVTTITQAIMNGFKTVKLTSTGKSYVTDLSNGMLSGVGTVSNAANTIVKTVINSLSTAVSQARGVGEQISAGVATGIRNGSFNVQSAMTEVANNAVAAAKRALDINSPSRVMAWVGKMVDEGLAGGILRNAKTVVEAGVETLSKLIDATQQGMPTIHIPAEIASITVSGKMSSLLADFESLAVAPIDKTETLTYISENKELLEEVKRLREEVKELKEELGDTIAKNTPDEFSMKVNEREFARATKKAVAQ